ncbi:MAG TPA: DUF2339 domain-containing protein [Thermoanaerobaculia bacterium]
MFIAIALAVIAAIALVIAKGVVRPIPGYDASPERRAEWTSIGIRFFSAVAGVAVMLSVVLNRAASIWGLFLGVVLLIVSELPIARQYRVTANAMAGAGIGILYAGLYALHADRHVPLAMTFAGMLIVTAAAAYLAVRRESFFIALLGVIGGFAVPALLGFDESAVSLFSYLLLLNAGISWIAYRKAWPGLTALAITLTVIYEWAWVLRYLNSSQLPLAAFFFALLSIVGASPLFFPLRGEPPVAFQRAAAAAAMLPLPFAFYMALVPNYALRYNVLFGFLLVIAVGLAAVVWRGAPQWLDVIGGVATLTVFVLWFGHWLTQSYRDELWPVTAVPGLVFSIAMWTAAFVVLYLIRDIFFAALLFVVFIGLAIRQPQDYATLILAMLLLLIVVVIAMLVFDRPVLAAIAIAFSALALMALNPLPLLWPLFPAHALYVMPAGLLFVAHVILFIALFGVAWVSRRHVLTILAIPFYAGVVITATPSASSPILLVFLAFVPYGLFMLYVFAVTQRRNESLAPYIAASLATLVFFMSAWGALDGTRYGRFIGIVPLVEALVMAGLAWRVAGTEPREPRLTLVASTALLFFNAAIPLLFMKEWVVILWAIEAAALMFFFTRRFAHPALIVWASGLIAVVFVWLAFDGDLDAPSLIARIVFVGSALAMFAAAYFSPGDMPGLRLYFSLAGLIASWFRVNIEIANFYHATGGSLNFELSTPAEDVTYTVAWGVIATGLLLIGLVFRWQGARVGALSLLFAAIFKAFVHDLRCLDGGYRATSLFVLAVSLALVGIALQKFSRQSVNAVGMT